ncbi:MAG: di-/tricarboxylate transporter [Firmicutes bacterium]|nr:di-/tricarboxylate transporter [Bacillota bacterium]
MTGESRSVSRIQQIKRVVAVLVAISAIGIFFMSPPQGLTVQATRVLGILAWSIGFLVTETIPEFVTGFMMCLLFVMGAEIPFKTAFNMFSDQGWWMIVGAFGLGVAANKCGLLKRISLWVLKIMSPTFMGQVIGLLISGTVISPLIPSINAKAALAAPIALGIGENLQYEKQSSGMAALFGAMFIGCTCSGLIFMSSSISAYVLVRMCPPEYQNVTWMDWLHWAWPWGIMVITGYALSLKLLFTPKDKSVLPRSYGADRLKELGPMSYDEKITLMILATTLTLWMTEPIHKLPAACVALFAMTLLVALKVMNRDDFNKKIDWAAVYYVGSILNMAAVMQFTKIDLWLGKVMAPYIAAIIGDPYLFVFCIVVIISLLRFFVVSFTSACALIVLVLAPIVGNYGIHPWIVVFLTFTMASVFFIPYMSSIFLCGYYATGGDMISRRQTAILSSVYWVVGMIAMLAMVPYWQLIGLIK